EGRSTPLTLELGSGEIDEQSNFCRPSFFTMASVGRDAKTKIGIYRWHIARQTQADSSVRAWSLLDCRVDNRFERHLQAEAKRLNLLYTMTSNPGPGATQK